MDELLLDTDMVSEVFKRVDQVVVANADDYLLVHGELAFSLVTKYEMLRGLKWKGAAIQLAKFNSICSSARILGVDDAIVERASQLWADAVNSGKPSRSSDILIAATALEHNLALCTGNSDHFSWIPGLRLVN